MITKMKMYKKILHTLLLIFYIIVSFILSVITFNLIKYYDGFDADLIIIGLFIMATIGSIVEIIPGWFRENFWYCKHCNKFNWLISKYETVKHNTITHKICEKCKNKVHTLDYYD